MQKVILLILIFLSQVIFSAPKITETEKLASTCKVWGFLKYYHPEVAGGKVNWDDQLLEKLPKIEKAQTKEEFSLILENWIDELGPVKEIAPITVSKDVKYFDKNFDLSWFNDKLFSKRLSKKLKFIEENRFQTTEEFGPDFDGFKNHKNYFDLNYDAKDSRILMLFTYWNVIEYFFPYKYKMNQNWNKTLEESLPSISIAKNMDEFLLAMKKMSTQLNDGHVMFHIYPSLSLPSPAKHYFPATGKIIDEKLVVTEILGDSLADAYDIKIGNVITKINDKSIKDYIEESRSLVSASNEASYLNKVVNPILTSYSENVKVEFLKDGKYETKQMVWFNYHDSHRNEFKKGAQKKKDKFKLLDNNIGYVDMGVIKQRNIPNMIASLKETKAIVFDMRNYPQNTWKEISDFINPEEKKFAIYTYPYLNYPGKYEWKEGVKAGFDNKNNYKGKVVVLVNEDSFSQSEWTAMSFQTAGNTTIIGSQTAGTDGNVFEFDFQGFHTGFSGIGVYYPDGRETQRIGIIPDIEIKPTIKGIQEGKDEVLDRALLFIETGK
ncbi:C-terminal processing protease CtpA/Prc [Flavobacterium nitrogenifigens]|uniref:C-terminal processing protease CtpA/Prc n=2 Tax=Flavobacterium TaxID=237 RepID=A0A7W7N5C0_9FLAO|nr:MULTISPECIES: S41 family peptidase [Flavobacterium]MBB4800600.1 C-terminal processing protease CtpA/Prc [Flavobacterium nitrogenifigens]MBB6385653.1 C-terminal processing protease CtpA/Prc [Flavobacterium notoginsengisoli]